MSKKVKLQKLKPLFLGGMFVVIFSYSFIPRALEIKESHFSLAKESNLKIQQVHNNLLTVQENSLLPVPRINFGEERITKRIRVLLTGYSSSPFETDDTPYITASGSFVREGIVASNLLPFGTKIKIPELFGDKVFVVEDRLNPKNGLYHIDIWFPSRKEALRFGKKWSYIEVIK